MPSKDQFFYYSSLFSQSLSSLEPVLKETSCMNPEDAELIGLCMSIIPIIKERNPERAEILEKKIIPMLETIGMGKWIKGEVTHLGLRLGHRDKRNIDLSSDVEETEDADASTDPEEV